MTRGIVKGLPARHCVACGERYTPRTAIQKYCSSQCAPAKRTVRLTPNQVNTILEIAAQLS